MSTFPPESSSPPPVNARRIQRGKIGLVAIIGGVLALASAMLWALQFELRIREASPGPSFERYVADHHLGIVSDVTDGTATDPSTTILTLYEAIPNTRLQRSVIEYMQLFVQYDHGQSLILQEPGPDGRLIQAALAHYDPQNGRLTLDLRPPGAPEIHLELQESW
jgi:hypothetical protein